MAITSNQRKALEAAGYTVKGNTVMNKSGGSVGGYNENGKIWSGSEKVRSILKSSPQAPAKTAPAKPAKQKTAPAKKETPVAKDAMKGYRKGDVTTSRIAAGGRGDGRAERIRRMADAALDKVAKKPVAAKKPAARGGLSDKNGFSLRNLFSGKGGLSDR